MALHGNTLLVGEHGTGKIIALHKTTGVKLGEFATGARKLFGLAVEPTTGDVWFVDGDDSSSVGYINRTRTCEAAGAAPVPPAAAGSTITFPATPSSEGDRPYCIPEEVALGTEVHNIAHDDGYLNMTPLGPGYGTSPECMACAPGCDNDMLLMSGFLCHKCLPDNCRDGGVYSSSKGTCSNIIGKGYSCTCDDGAYGDHCQHRVKDTNGGGDRAGGGLVLESSAGVLCAAPYWVAYVFVLVAAVSIYDAEMFI